MKEKYFKPEDWYYIKFNNKVYFSQNSQGKLRIICRLEEQYCPNCIQEEEKPKEKNKKCYHC